MKLRSGNIYEFPMNQPFKLILLKEKVPNKKKNKEGIPPVVIDFEEGIPPMVIDFEKASREWMKNKINLGGGMFVYKSPGRKS